jgi:hypothetical protein
MDEVVKTVIVLNELGHVEMCERYLTEHKGMLQAGYLIIPLDLEVERALSEKGIPFRSGGPYRTEGFTHMLPSEAFTAAVFDSERWSFFAYRGVSLGELYFLQLQWYLSHVLYYFDIIANVLARHPEAARLVVCSSTESAPRIGSTLMGLQIQALAGVAQYIAQVRGIEAEVVPTPHAGAAPYRSTSFALKRRLIGIALAGLNMFVRLSRTPRSIRVLASDSWHNLAPYVNHFDSLEITLIDRGEALKAGLRNIWKFRMRFLHADAFPARASGGREQARESIAREWSAITDSGQLPEFEFHGFTLRPLIVAALERIVEEVVAKTLRDIDDTYELFARTLPQVVLLRVTSSLQVHFSMLAQVARSLGVPSLEVLHGLEYTGPGSQSRRHTALYSGVYGLLSKKEMEESGGGTSIPVVIGSPRFDVYRSLKKETIRTPDSRGGISILCIMPTVDPCAVDTYDVDEYISAIAEAVHKIPNASIVAKFRPGPLRDDFAKGVLSERFASIPYIIRQYEPLSDIFPTVDIVISCYSTAALEALQCGKPLIYLGLSPAERMMGLHHFAPYVEAGAMRLDTTASELAHDLHELASDAGMRATLSQSAVAFLDRQYAFDGHAGQRMADFIRSLASKANEK